MAQRLPVPRSLGNEVNVGVLAVAIRPFVPLPDFGKKVFEMGVLLKKGFGDFFKAVSALPVAEGFFSDFGDGFFKVHFRQRPASKEKGLCFFRFCLFCAPSFLPRNKKAWTKHEKKSGMRANYL